MPMGATRASGSRAWASAPAAVLAPLVVVATVVALYVAALVRASRVYRLPLLRRARCEAQVHMSGVVNPCIAVPFRIGRYESIFVLDTGYAGAPVLNARFLSHSANADVDGTLRDLARIVSSAERAHSNVSTFVHANRCAEYTSGCVLRLMGIGTTAERVSDMLLCPSIELKAPGGAYFSVKEALDVPRADVLMTNHDMSSPHILTLDYLMHLSPCLLSPGKGTLSLALGAAEFVYQRALSRPFSEEIDGGAYMCQVVLDGHALRCTVDTGASMTLCIGPSVARKLALRRASTPRHTRQMGINSELVCSDMHTGTLEVCGQTFAGAAVFVNDSECSGSDGYLGLGVLRAFDLLITPRALFARPSSLGITEAHAYANVLHDGACEARPPPLTPRES